MDLWNEMDTKIESSIKNSNGKNIVIWGYGYSGKFIEHWFKRRNKKIEFFIDDHKDIPYQMKVFTSSILSEIDSKDYFIICCFNRDDESEKILIENGYIEKQSYIYLLDCIGDGYDRKISYYDWLDYFYNTNISSLVNNAEGQNLFYSTGCDYALVDVLDDFVFCNDDSAFDFGIGKGGAAIMFSQKGCGKVAGVEIDDSLCDIAKLNFAACGIESCSIYNADATSITEELDSYNYFHMYNPFGRDIFEKVIRNMEDSFERKQRKIIFIYSGVTCHNEVIKNGKFRLVKKILNNYWSKYTNIYIME